MQKSLVVGRFLTATRGLPNQQQGVPGFRVEDGTQQHSVRQLKIFSPAMSGGRTLFNADSEDPSAPKGCAGGSPDQGPVARAPRGLLFVLAS